MSSVRDFGAFGDGQTDDTEAIRHAIEQGDGEVIFPRGDYLIREPIVITLAESNRVSLRGSGGTAKLIMAGPGPTLHLIGSHDKSADPQGFAEGVWQRERMPTIAGLEIEGRHAEADGVRLEGVMQPTLTGLLIRRCRHGIHLVKRDRNVLIADCHIYNNSGVGVYLEGVNLHQINIHGSHISYNKQGGIRIERSEVRNIQICANDIEYNYDLAAESSADVLFDCREGTVREGTIVGNTIQAKESPHGANVRLIGVGRDDPNAVGLLAITGNLLGSQETVVHLQASRGVVVTGNCIYSGYQRALWIEDSEHVIVSGGAIDQNPEYQGNSTDAVVIERSRHVSLNGLIIQHTKPPTQEVEATIDIQDCENVQAIACQIINARKRGLRVQGSRLFRVAECTILGKADDRTYLAPLRTEGSTGMVVHCFLGRGAEGERMFPPGVVAEGNLWQ